MKVAPLHHSTHTPSTSAIAGVPVVPVAHLGRGVERGARQREPVRLQPHTDTGTPAPADPGRVCSRGYPDELSVTG